MFVRHSTAYRRGGHSAVTPPWRAALSSCRSGLHVRTRASPTGDLFPAVPRFGGSRGHGDLSRSYERSAHVPGPVCTRPDRRERPGRAGAVLAGRVAVAHRSHITVGNGSYDRSAQLGASRAYRLALRVCRHYGRRAGAARTRGLATKGEGHQIGPLGAHQASTASVTRTPSSSPCDLSPPPGAIFGTESARGVPRAGRLAPEHEYCWLWAWAWAETSRRARPGLAGRCGVVAGSGRRRTHSVADTGDRGVPAWMERHRRVVADTSKGRGCCWGPDPLPPSRPAGSAQVLVDT